jgi:nitrate/nitrite transport system permease protein
MPALLIPLRGTPMDSVSPNRSGEEKILPAPETLPVKNSNEASAPRRRTPLIETETAGHLRNIMRQTFKQAIPPLLGILLFISLWSVIANIGKAIPGPLETWLEAVKLFSHPFYDNGPNDKGIGLNILNSLYRVGLGFGLAAMIGIPLGFMIGRFDFLDRMTAPIISILRPVSPLAWLPIGLLLLKKAEPASIWVIFISSIWPMVLNTAVGVKRIPQDYMNVARVLNLSEFKIFTKILLPAVMPYVLTGVRLSVGVAWLVIVAAEMLTGGVGIGFWVWDEWNNLNVTHIIIAIFVVGIVGLLLEQGLMLIAKRFEYD